MSDESPRRGRLFLVTAPSEDGAAAVALGLGRLLPRAFVIAGSQVESMVVSGGAPDQGAGLEAVRQRLLRWSACLAAAETYQLEGFDAVVHDVVVGEHLEDFLDLAAPETVHLVVLDEPQGSPTPRWGLWLEPGSAPDHQLAQAALERLDEAAVLTAEPAEPAEPAGPAEPAEPAGPAEPAEGSHSG
ncbi:hypothetical protein [Intrasporangium sp.]|uniref:hypothetical protein n=1 Tax=Intrasporangium sp. TaxID=1925024 RepID=UPI00293A890E|nr:hypothetical protein [Intrasporangium sp.]MDV3221790.1 hypothetical protein [Intrasporangium sp.]